MDIPRITTPSEAIDAVQRVDALLGALTATPHLDAPLTMDCTHVTVDLDIPLSATVGQGLLAALEVRVAKLRTLLTEQTHRNGRLESRLNAATESTLNVEAKSEELGETTVVDTGALDAAAGIAWRNREDLDEGRM